MNFAIKIDSQTSDLKEEWINDADFLNEWASNSLLVSKDYQHIKVDSFESDKNKVWIIGDIIEERTNANDATKFSLDSNFQQLFKSIQGHYRVIVFNKESRSVLVASSLFGILPVYYIKKAQEVFISSSLELLAKQTGQQEIDKRFILENILFYYPLFDNTIYKKIRLLPTHHQLKVTNANISCLRYFNVTDWFSADLIPWEKAAEKVSDLFIDRVGYYFPDEDTAVSLTGGFDGRTLVSCALYHHKKFQAYSFGKKNSSDTAIANELAHSADINFSEIDLNKDYVSAYSLNNGLEFIVNSNGTGGFARAHYLYAAKLLQSNVHYLITGNFGSEIFRAVHNIGAVISTNLHHLFAEEDFNNAINLIEKSGEFNWLNKESFRNEWGELKNDLKRLPAFDPQYSSLTRNEKFYQYLLEEVFRKYFGAEMVNQFRYLNNRTPFIDSKFLEALYKTGMPGVYSDFMERNPIKRFKGQVIYAHIIKKTYPSFLNKLTDKGYAPGDLLTLSGKASILGGFISKKILKKTNASGDSNSVDEALRYNRPYFKNLEINDALFNRQSIETALLNDNCNHDFLIALSQSYYSNYIAGSL
jgi:asparagine synthetase B (glutamine-hydrolysing)